MTDAQREPSSSNGLSAAELLAAWLQRVAAAVAATGWRGIAGTVFGATAGVALALWLPSQYTSTASFIAQGSAAPSLPSALQGFAATVGLGVTRDYSPHFYSELLTSRPVLLSALERPYVVPLGDSWAERSYYAIERIRGSDSLTATETGLKHLRRRVTPRADVRTNIITVSVTARYPTLSRDLLKALLSALDSMNIGLRQNQSRMLREFFEGRAQEAQRELADAESTLRAFLEHNRVTTNSPLLTFEQMRLTRAADLKRTVYMTVVQQYEEAKIQESRNVPVLTILTEPPLPVRKSGPPRRFIVVAMAVVGFALVMSVQHGPVVIRRLRARQPGPVDAFEHATAGR